MVTGFHLRSGILFPLERLTPITAVIMAPAASRAAEHCEAWAEGCGFTPQEALQRDTVQMK